MKNLKGKLFGKTAIITGSTRGFGLSIANAYLKEGANVVISSRSRESIVSTLEQLHANKSTVVGKTCDIAELSQVNQLARFAIDTFGKFDIWVNNAAVTAPYGPSLYIDPKVFEQVIRVNILGTYYGSIIAMQQFLEQGSGKLINISGIGDKKPVPMQIAYASSKAWLIQFTRALAQENQTSNIGVYLLNPGMMNTDLLQNVEVISGYEHRLDNFENVIRVLAQPPDIPAKKAVWLASDATNGQTGLVLRELTNSKIVKNIIKQILSKLFHHAQKSVELDINTIPPYQPIGKKEL